MTVTDTVLVLFIVALLAYAIYDEFIMPRRHGETLLTLPLLRRGCLYLRGPHRHSYLQ